MDLWYITNNTGSELDSTFDQCSTALRRLSELKSRRDVQENRATALKQLVTHFSLQLPNPSTNASFLMLRSEASKAVLSLKEMVL